MGGEMQYSLDTTVADCWKTELPQAKDAGTHNVYYRVAGDKNHHDSYYPLIAVNIAKAELTVTGTWGEGKTPNLTSSDKTLYTWSTDFSGALEGTSTWRTLTKDEWV